MIFLPPRIRLEERKRAELTADAPRERAQDERAALSSLVETKTMMKGELERMAAVRGTLTRNGTARIHHCSGAIRRSID